MYLWEEFLKLVFQKKKVISKIKPLYPDHAVKCFLQVVNYARIRNMLERECLFYPFLSQRSHVSKCERNVNCQSSQ